MITYGSKVINATGVLQEEYVTSDTRSRVLFQNNVCSISEFDFRTEVAKYDKSACSTYTFDDT
ncbi:hypothetical protein [Sulfurimonas sp.]